MRALFFDSAGAVLFERSDDETATVQHEELTLQALYPYRDDKIILRGMRIGYQDALGDWQVFEIRKAKTYEQDHYQEITAEHICISELTDEHFVGAEWTDVTAAAALGEILTGTGWAVGTSTASNTSSANASMGNVWQDVRTIENNWNVYILPRVTVGDAGITGKYLDIVPAGGTWRGMRLSLDKNADEVGVTWDDTKLKTALYAYGASVEVTVGGEKQKKPLTFEDVEWTQTQDHPAKPLGQAYLEDPAATAAFGRNGRSRFGYYQNGDINDAQTLLEKTWESLKTLNTPDVTIDCVVTDLYRLGYTDVPIRLHDTALVEIRPTGIVLQKEVIQYTEDLNDPSQSRLVIGVYIPNIIYINRETSKAAGGGGGGGGGQTDGEYKESLFVTQINANEYGLSVTSAELQEVKGTVITQGAQLQIDRTGISSLATGTGAQLNPDGTLVVDSQGNPIFVDQNNCLYTKITQNAANITLEATRATTAEGNLRGAINVEADKITQIVTAVGSNGEVTAASIVASVNSAGSSVVIDADHIDLNGIVTAQVFETALASIAELTGDLHVAGSVTVGGHLSSGDIDVESLSGFKVDGTSIGLGDAVNGFGTPTVSGGQVSIPYTTLSGGSGTINFNKAAAGIITGINQRQTAAYSTTDKEYTVYPTATGTDITNAPYDAQIFVSGLAAYNHGYDTASGQVSLPGSGSSASFAFAYPKTTTSGGTTTRTQSLTSYALETTNGNLTVSVTSGSGAGKVTHAEATCSDSNLDAGNIKDGVVIFGITGTYTGTQPYSDYRVVASWRSGSADYGATTSHRTLTITAQGKNASGQWVNLASGSRRVTATRRYDGEADYYIDIT